MTGVDTLTGIVFPYANFILFLILLWRFTKKPAKAASEKKSEEYRLLYEKASASYEEAKERLDCLNDRYSSLEKEIEVLETALLDNVKKEYQESLTLLTSIPGIGTKTALMLLVFTDGFQRFESVQIFQSFQSFHSFLGGDGTSAHQSNFKVC